MKLINKCSFILKLMSNKGVINSSVIEEEKYIQEDKPKKTTPYMSQYEYCALISTRVLQLSNPQESPKVDIEDDVFNYCYDPLVIATKEVQQRLVTLVIRRKFIDGTTEDWFVKDMIYPRV